MKYTLVAKVDDEFGGTGLVVREANVEGYNPCQEGRLVAHDLLEHHNLEIGGVGNELKAMGGMWFIRGQHEDVVRTPNVNTAVDHAAMDIGYDLYSKWLSRDFECPTPKILSCRREDEFLDIMEASKRQARDNDLDMSRWNEYVETAYKFFVDGFLKAQNRWRIKGGSQGANTLFWRIAEEVDGILKYIEEGQEFILNISLNYKTVSIEEIEPEWY